MGHARKRKDPDPVACLQVLVSQDVCRLWNTTLNRLVSVLPPLLVSDNKISVL